MANSLLSDTRLNESLALARRSKSLAPEIKHWCSHLKIVSEYGGIIGEMGLPTMHHVSCPQANGGAAMNLEWVAHNFIIENCQNCQFHSEVFPKNFGRKVLENYKEQLDKVNKEKEEEQIIKDEVRSKLKARILDRFKFAKTTEISILKLVDKLSDSDDKLAVAESILESSRLKPAFFNSLALDYLVLFFDTDDISADITKAVVNVLLTDSTKLSEFARGRILDSFAKVQNLNLLVRIVQILNLPQKEEIVLATILIDNYFLETFTRQDDPFEDFSPFIIKYFHEYSCRQEENFKCIVRNSLTDSDSGVRKNACLILYQLYILEKEVAFPFIEDMIDAYNFEEDSSGGSDWTICRTLIKFCYADVDLILNAIAKKLNKMSAGGKVQILKFYDKFLDTNDLRESFPAQSSALIDKVVGFAANNEIQDDLENPFTILRKLTRSYPANFNDKFDVFLGLLINAIKEKNTFNWNKENLDSNTTTFNPLVGLNIYEMMTKETKISAKLNNIKDILVHLVQENEAANFDGMLKIIRNLDSNKPEDVEVKIYLISVVRSSIKSHLSLVQILPDIYNWLLDMNALHIRIEALKLLATLLEDHFEIIPQTITDLLVLLVKDDDVLIKKFAIDAYGQIIAKKPSIVSDETINYLMGQYESRYIGINHAMCGLTNKLLKILPAEKHRKLYGKVVVLLHAHCMQKDKDHDFCQTLLRQAIALNRKVNEESYIPYEKNIVENYLLPDCSDSDFYKSEKAIKIVQDLRKNNFELNEMWLTSVLALIYKYKPHHHEMAVSNSFRKEYYREMYNLRRSDITKEADSIVSYLKKHLVEIDLYDFDVINILNIFGYFSMHRENLDLCTYIMENVNNVPSNNYFFRVVNDHKFLSEMALAGKGNTLSKFFLKTN